MDSSVIVLDSDDEDTSIKEVKVPEDPAKPAIKRSASITTNGDDSPASKIRRIQPLKIGEVSAKTSSKDESDSDQKDTELESKNGIAEINEDEKEEGEESVENGEASEDLLDEKPNELEAGPSTAPVPLENELTPQIKDLIKACKAAEHSTDMKKVIKGKLLKYYHSVHPDYVTSKTFLKSLKSTTEEILKEPHLVYAKLKIVIDELDARRKTKGPVFVNEESVEVKGTGDEAKDKMLKKLYKALVKIKQHIRDLEEAEVDWEDDDNSAYIKKVRFEKRACEIYEKICEITGESTHAHRIVKKPIKFKGTDFPDFNKKLTKMVNVRGSFPNFLEVLRVLDFCNKKHEFGLLHEQLKRVAQDAFEKLGKILQQRRKDDLYESTTFYIGKSDDPAKSDPELRSRLEKNKKFYGRTDDLINEFAEKENVANSDDGEEVSSTSKTEQPPAEIKETAEMSPNDLKEERSPDCDILSDKCDKNGATIITLNDDDDDLMIVES